MIQLAIGGLAGVLLVIASIFSEAHDQAWTALLVGVCGGFVLGIAIALAFDRRRAA